MNEEYKNIFVDYYINKFNLTTEDKNNLTEMIKMINWLYFSTGSRRFFKEFLNRKTTKLKNTENLEFKKEFLLCTLYEKIKYMNYTKIV